MINRLIRFFRTFFSFSHSESKGFVVMATGIAVLAVFYLVYNALPSEGYNSLSHDQARLDSLVGLIETREKLSAETEVNSGRANVKKTWKKQNVMIFHFNPNELSVDSLKLLGFPYWLAERIGKYRQKGGVFREKEDLLKIYGFSDTLFLRLKPYISIPPAPQGEYFKENKHTPGKKQFVEEEPGSSGAVFSLNLNEADSLQLLRLKGIGPVLSGRMLRFRNKMGGFVSLNQLYEVYGIDSSVVEGIMEVAYIEADFQPEKLDINAASLEELTTHPYISRARAGLIYSYKTQHGPFISESDLLRIHTFDSIFVRKIAPYIRFDQ